MSTKDRIVIQIDDDDPVIIIARGCPAGQSWARDFPTRSCDHHECDKEWTVVGTVHHTTGPYRHQTSVDFWCQDHYSLATNFVEDACREMHGAAHRADSPGSLGYNSRYQEHLDDLATVSGQA